MHYEPLSSEDQECWRVGSAFLGSCGLLSHLARTRVSADSWGHFCTFRPSCTFAWHVWRCAKRLLRSGVMILTVSGGYQRHGVCFATHRLGGDFDHEVMRPVASERPSPRSHRRLGQAHGRGGAAGCGRFAGGDEPGRGAQPHGRPRGGAASEPGFGFWALTRYDGRFLGAWVDILWTCKEFPLATTCDYGCDQLRSGLNIQAGAYKPH